MIVAYIDAHQDRFGVEPICKVLSAAGTQVAPSTYYAARTRRPSRRSVTDAQRTAAIRAVYEDNYGVYGSRKVHAELLRRGVSMARCSVERLMRVAGLKGVSRAKGPRTTIPGTGPEKRPDLVERKFTAAAPNRLGVHPLAGEGPRTSPTAAPSRGGSTPRSSSTSSAAAWWAGRCPRACAPTWPWTPWRWVCGPARTPAEVFAEQLWSLQQPGVASTG